MIHDYNFLLEYPVCHHHVFRPIQFFLLSTTAIVLQFKSLGKTWHPEHFVCAKCEKPFHGSRHYERRGLAYCEIHYHQLFGDLCFVCNNVIPGDGKISIATTHFMTGFTINIYSKPYMGTAAHL